MSDESTSTSLAEVASDAFGAKFHGPAAPRTNNAPATRPHYKSPEEAHAAREARKPKPKQKPVTAPAQDDTDSAEATDSGPRWSDQDLADLQLFQTTATQAAQAAQAFAARYTQALRDARANSFEELARFDPSEAAALQAEFRPIHQAAKQVEAMRNTIATELSRRALEAERAKLFAAIPSLADENKREEFIGWCTQQGYSREQVLGVTDPDTVKMAWRAYAAETAQAARGKQPKFRANRRPQPQPQTNSAEAQALARLEETGSITDALELMTIRRSQKQRRSA